LAPGYGRNPAVPYGRDSKIMCMMPKKKILETSKTDFMVVMNHDGELKHIEWNWQIYKVLQIGAVAATSH
jgi:hypothetical protein